MIEIREIRRQDYKKAQQFAIQGMHFDWYMDSKVILDLYARYFWDMELNRATKAYGAYVGDAFVGVLLADMKGEPKKFHSRWRKAYVKFIDWLQRRVAGAGVGTYDKANREMYQTFCESHVPDGEIVFLAAAPNCKVKGVGTALLSAFEAENWFTFTRMMAAPINSMSTEDLQGLENGRSCWLWKKRKFH